MANNYIPGFTPSLHGQPVKRMALGGRMESGRWFNEGRDRDTGDMPYTPEVASAAPAVAQSIASSPVAALTAAAPTAAAPTAAAYQQPTPEPAQANYGFDPYDLSGFDMYGLGEYASQFYQQPTPQTAATNYQSLPTQQPVQTAPYVDYATPTSYQRQPTPQPVQTAPYYNDYSSAYSPLDYGYDPYGIGDYANQLYQPPVYQQSPPTPAAAQPTVASADYSQFTQPATPLGTANNVLQGVLDRNATGPFAGAANYLDRVLSQDEQQGLAQAAQPATPPGALPPGMSWGAYSNPNDPTSQYTVTFTSKKKGDRPLTVTPETPVFLYDNRTKQIIASGVGKEGADAVAAAASSIGAKEKDAWWDIYTGTPGATDPSQFKVAVSDDKNKSFGERFLSAMGTILPIATAFIPGLGQASLLTQIGAGAASGAAGAALKGQNILTGALTGGATAGLLNAPVLSGGKSLSGVVGGALESVPVVGGALKEAGKVTGGGTSSYNPITNEIVTTATKSGTPALISGALSSGLQGALSTAAKYPGTVKYGDQVWGEQPTVQEPGASTFNPDEGISVFANKYKMPFDPNSTLNAFLGSQFGNLVNPDYSGLGDLANQYEIQEPQEDIPEGSDEGWTVEAPKENVIIPPSAAIPELFPPINSVDIPTDLVKEWPEVPTEENEIVVEGERPSRPGGGVLPIVIPPVPITSVQIPPNAGLELPPTDTKKPSISPSDIAKIIGAIAGGAAGGGGGSSFVGARGALNPIFSAKLPSPSLRPAAPRALDFDAYRYGYGPEQSFFTNVPQGALNTSTAYTGYGTSPRYTASEQYAADFAALLEAIKKEEEARAASAVSSGFAQGGYAVGGPGDGREDKIPAMLSDGEYVIDAETVAMLGNGSSKAGADALDKFRVNIRKHKGRKLSKGEFSVDAKKPEQYLKGHK